ncbi:HU family DNA-binding protein [Bacteroides fragilis]|uniref:HU family DNA-binding protein n=1 Tax=Bacteroides TaxID=816 RepID=UPI0014864E87
MREHKACLGRNSFTGLRIQIPACKVVQFSLGNSLRGAVMKTWINERRILSSSGYIRAAEEYGAAVHCKTAGISAADLPSYTDNET